jgi:hypothetical protein
MVGSSVIGNGNSQAKWGNGYFLNLDRGNLIRRLNRWEAKAEEM